MSDFARLQELARDAGVAIYPPSNTVVPAVTPLAATVGDTLSCTTGEWNGPTPTGYAYSWQHAGAEIGTGSTYTTVNKDADTVVECVVTATNGAGTASAPPSNSVAVRKKAEAAPAAAPADTKRK